MITSNQNPKLKLTRQLLQHAKQRREAQAFAAEGVRLVEEALERNWGFRFVLYGEHLSPRGERLLDAIQAKGIATEMVADPLLNAMSDTNNTQGILAVLEMLGAVPLPKPLTLILIVDQIRDPGNLGTLLRSAAAAGVQAVFLPAGTTDAFAPKVVRAGMGSHFQLPILTMSWEEMKTSLEGLEVLVADMKGGSCWEADLRTPLALIIGGEAEGASSAARRLATGTISIPMPGGSESLNAGAAGSILLFEVVRQRSIDKRTN